MRTWTKLAVAVGLVVALVAVVLVAEAALARRRGQAAAAAVDVTALATAYQNVAAGQHELLAGLRRLPGDGGDDVASALVAAASAKGREVPDDVRDRAVAGAAHETVTLPSPPPPVAGAVPLALAMVNDAHVEAANAGPDVARVPLDAALALGAALTADPRLELHLAGLGVEEVASDALADLAEARGDAAGAKLARSQGIALRAARAQLAALYPLLGDLPLTATGRDRMRALFSCPGVPPVVRRELLLSLAWAPMRTLGGRLLGPSEEARRQLDEWSEHAGSDLATTEAEARRVMRWGLVRRFEVTAPASDGS